MLSMFKLLIFVGLFGCALGRWKCGSSLKGGNGDSGTSSITPPPPIISRAMYTGPTSCAMFTAAFDGDKIQYPRERECRLRLVPIARQYPNEKRTILMSGAESVAEQDLNLPISVHLGMAAAGLASYEDWATTSNGIPNILQRQLCELGLLDAFAGKMLELFTFKFASRVETRPLESAGVDNIWFQLVGTCELSECKPSCDQTVVKMDVFVNLTVPSQVEGLGCTFEPTGKSFEPEGMKITCPHYLCKNINLETLDMLGCIC